MEIYEILDSVNAEPSKNKKVEILMSNDSVALRSLMRINFDPDLNIHVTKNIQWEPNISATKGLNDIIKHIVPLSNQGKYEQKRADASFKAMLESIHVMDAQYLLDAVNKKLKVRGLTLRLAEEIWGKRIFN